MNRDGDVGAHVLRDVDWQVIEERAVGEDVILFTYGRENSGEGHGGTQREREGAGPKDFFLAGDEVGGDATERNGKIVEIFDFGVWQRELIENQTNGLARIESLGKLNAVFETEAE
ncbi:MAG: hypothetical protein ABSC71_20375, partial [Candidatus Acidiferrales bacterium]